MNNNYTQKTYSPTTEHLKTSKAITEFTTEINRMCPSCMNTHVISKGKQPKTGEMRAECKACGKQFATLFSENLAKVFAEKEKLQEELCTLAKAETKRAYDKVSPDKDKNREESIEQILRGNEIKPTRKLQLLYFKNIKRNRISKVKQVIVENTAIPRAQLINIDFMDDGTLEIFCWHDKCETILSELAKLKLEEHSPDLSGSEDTYEAFKSRMKNIANRRDNTKVVLKRYASKLSNMSKKDLQTEITHTATKSITMAGSDSLVSIEINSDDS